MTNPTPDQPSTTPAPLPPSVVSAILRDPDSPLYPSKIVVFCDDCRTEVASEFMVSTEQSSAQRLEVARAHFRTQGWQCNEAGDLCPACAPAAALSAVLAEVRAERARQDAKFGEQNHPDGTGYPGSEGHADYWRQRCQTAFADDAGTWGHVLLEEVFEALAEADPAQLRTELVQVAAVAVAWAEAIDRRTS